MTIVFVILVILVSVVLGLIVLIQNPKGGGLAGNIAGFSTQFMGVKQTTDVLEKGTWILAAVIGALCLASTMFISNAPAASRENIDKIGTQPIQNTQPANTTPFQTTPANPNTNPPN